MAKKKTEYEVSGAQAFMETPPGGTFKADPDDPQIQRAIEVGSIRENKASPTASHDSEEE